MTPAEPSSRLKGTQFKIEVKFPAKFYLIKVQLTAELMAQRSLGKEILLPALAQLDFRWLS